jgi:hypothetical protein
MVRQPRSIPTDCFETRTLASVLWLTSRTAGSDCLKWDVLLSCAPQPATCPAECMPVMPFTVGELPGSGRRTAAALYGIVYTQLV